MSDISELNIPTSKILKVLNAKLIYGEEIEKVIINSIYASDLMSDVLAYGSPDACLLTGLNSMQAVISSYMAEFKAIVFLRGKIPDKKMMNFGKEKGIVIMSTICDMFEACVNIAKIDDILIPKTKVAIHKTEKDNNSKHEFHIDGRDFANSGMVSTNIKSILKKIGYAQKLIRRVAIATYEAEMNVVMHAKKAEVTLNAGNDYITVTINDEGKGIPNVKKAMEPGFSTATESQRAMGFGAGMGLPNIEKNTDDFTVNSIVNEGTELIMRFNNK